MAELQREEIPARIKKARKEAGLTQPEMADLLDVAARTYQNYESDRVPWNLINQIAKITGRSSEWLLHGEPKPTPDLMSALAPAQLDRIEALLEDVRQRIETLEETVGVTAVQVEAEIERLVDEAVQTELQRTETASRTERAQRRAGRAR